VLLRCGGWHAEGCGCSTHPRVISDQRSEASSECLGGGEVDRIEAAQPYGVKLGREIEQGIVE
jgi:hypothetical protein